LQFNVLRLRASAKKVRNEGGGKNADHRNDDHEFDKREACLALLG
jgi:hypothetical protein